jgi:hypothetical protein
LTERTAQHWPRIRTANFHLDAKEAFTPKDLGEALSLKPRQARRIIREWFFDDVVCNRAANYVFADEIKAALGTSGVSFGGLNAPDEPY